MTGKAYNRCVLNNEVIPLKWSKLELMNATKPIFFSEELVFDAAAIARLNQLRGLQNVRAEGELRYEESDDRVYVDLRLTGSMILPCAISGEDVEYPFSTISTEIFAFVKGDEDAHETKGDVVELLPVIFQLISMEIPLKVVKDGVHYPKGKGWEVMREADWRKEKSATADPRLAKLKDFKFEDDAGGANDGSTAKT